MTLLEMMLLVMMELTFSGFRPKTFSCTKLSRFEQWGFIQAKMFLFITKGVESGI